MLIREANQQGRTVLFCSHVLQEIEEVCSQAAIMRSGRVVHEIDVLHLKSTHRVRGHGSLPPTLPPGVALHAQHDEEIKLDIEGALESYLPWLNQLGWKDLRIEPVGLRSIYERYHFPQKEVGN
jgi:ABC-2 type transport system ATP-binding protein